MIKTVWYWHKDRQYRPTEQKSPEIDPHRCGQLIFEKRAKIIQ